MDMISREASKVDAVKVRGKTFTQALMALMDQILSEFTNQSKKGRQSSLNRGVSKFKDKLDNALTGGLRVDVEAAEELEKIQQTLLTLSKI